MAEAVKKALVFWALLLLVSGCAVVNGTKPIVKIGLVAPFEGLYRPLGYGVLYAVKLAISERNAQGGVGGYMVELVALDDGNDPVEAVQSAKELALDPDVMGVIGHFSNAATLAALPEYRRAGLALVTLSTANAVTESQPHLSKPSVFRLCAKNEQLGKAAARFAVTELGVRRLAVIRGEDDLADAFIATAQSLGAVIALDDKLDTPGLLASLSEAKLDLIFFSGGAVEGASLIVQAREAGIEATFMGGSGLDSPKLVQIGGEAVEGTIYATVSPDVPEGRGFSEGYLALAGHLPGPYAALAYDATNVLLDALALAIAHDGKPTRRGVVTALAETQRHGLSGPIAFDTRGELIEPRIYIRQIKRNLSPKNMRECHKWGESGYSDSKRGEVSFRGWAVSGQVPLIRRALSA